MNPGATTAPPTSTTRAAGRSIDRRDPRDRVAADRDVSLEPRAAGAVDDAAVVEQEVVGRRLRANGRDDQTGGHTDNDEEAHQNAHGVGL